MLLKSACWQRLLGSLLVLGLVLGVSVEGAKANLSWTCTSTNLASVTTSRDTSGRSYSYAYAVNAGYYTTASPYCSTANIIGSISASITAADRNAIISGVTGSAIMTNITNKVNQAAANTMYNSKSAAQWAAEGYTSATNAYNQAVSVNNKLDNATYGLNAIKTAVDATAKKIDITEQTTTLTNKINSINSSITDITTEINNNIPPPFIHSLKGKNNATATSNGKFTVIIEAQNATEYRARYDNSAWTGWLSSKEIEITGIPKGVKIITVEAKNNKDETYSKEMTVFSL